MLGMMMQRPLLISDIITYAAEMYPNSEIVSVRTKVTSTVRPTPKPANAWPSLAMRSSARHQER